MSKRVGSDVDLITKTTQVKEKGVIRKSAKMALLSTKEIDCPFLVCAVFKSICFLISHLLLLCCLGLIPAMSTLNGFFNEMESRVFNMSIDKLKKYWIIIISSMIHQLKKMNKPLRKTPKI